MSRSDDDPDSAVEGLLQKYEQQEAVVLRAELVEFLKSPQCREQLEDAVQKPIEKIVLAALSNPKFQEQVRDTVIASLKPELAKAVQAALKDIKVTISPETQAQMRRDAEETVRSAQAVAQREALASTHTRLKSRVPMADRLMWGALGIIAVAIAIGTYYFSGSRERFPDTVPVDDPGVTETVSSPVDTTTVAASRTPALFDRYRAALDQVGPTNLPAPSSGELTCVDNAIRQVDRTPLDVARLRALLNGCPALGSRPTGASRIIAGVQAQITEEAKGTSCRALQPVTNDGRHGKETSVALTTYVGCTEPAGVPKTLETLGDYAAVGVYFIDKRMRDAG